VLTLPLAVIIPCWVFRLQEQVRRKKHPMYFEFYDAAMKTCFDASAKVKHDASYIEFHFKLLTEGLADGECTEEYFKERFERLANRQVETTRWFKEQQKKAEELFKEADIYAKRNKLKWGILYDSKR
jgi:hypothetical protein